MKEACYGRLYIPLILYYSPSQVSGGISNSPLLTEGKGKRLLQAYNHQLPILRESVRTKVRCCPDLHSFYRVIIHGTWCLYRCPMYGFSQLLLTLITSLDPGVRTRQLESSLDSFRSWLLISMHSCKSIVCTYGGE